MTDMGVEDIPVPTTPPTLPVVKAKERREKKSSDLHKVEARERALRNTMCERSTPRSERRKAKAINRPKSGMSCRPRAG
jgi:hypothetical protein